MHVHGSCPVVQTTAIFNDNSYQRRCKKLNCVTIDLDLIITFYYKMHSSREYYKSSNAIKELL